MPFLSPSHCFPLSLNWEEKYCVVNLWHLSAESDSEPKQEIQPSCWPFLGTASITSLKPTSSNWWLTSLNPVVLLFSLLGTKHMARSNWSEEGSIPAHGLRRNVVHHVGKAQCRGTRQLEHCVCRQVAERGPGYKTPRLTMTHFFLQVSTSWRYHNLSNQHHCLR